MPSRSKTPVSSRGKTSSQSKLGPSPRGNPHELILDGKRHVDRINKLADVQARPYTDTAAEDFKLAEVRDETMDLNESLRKHAERLNQKPVLRILNFFNQPQYDLPETVARLETMTITAQNLSWKKQSAGCSIPFALLPHSSSSSKDGKKVASKHFSDFKNPAAGCIVRAETATGGSCAQVHKALLLMPGEDEAIAKYVAVKDFGLRQSHKSPSTQDEDERRIEREAYLWSRLRHDNITPFYGLYDARGQPQLLPFLASAWAKHGTARDYLTASTRHHAPDLIKDVMEGLTYLHNGHVILENLEERDLSETNAPIEDIRLYHADIDLRNIFISERPNGAPLAWLGDFGRSGSLSQPEIVSTLLSENYNMQAPELASHIALSRQHRTSGYSLQYELNRRELQELMEQADVYSFTILAYQMLTGLQPPVDWTRNPNPIDPNRAAFARHPLIPKDLWKLILNGLSTSPKSRGTMKEFRKQYLQLYPKFRDAYRRNKFDR